MLFPILLSLTASGAFGQPAAIQLNLQSCAPSATWNTSLVWAHDSLGRLVNGGQCATYDTPTTNLLMAPCDPSNPLQVFVFDGATSLLRNPSTGLCADVQYYGNTSGALLGLYECTPHQAWNQFVLDEASGHITNTQLTTLCVNGALPPPPLPTAQQLAWMDTEVSLMISYDLVTQLTEVPNPQHFCINAGGDKGFPVPPPTRFDPSNATFTDSWMEAARAAGAGYTLLVASHCAGFLQWQSNVTLKDGSPYPYTVAQSSWKGGKGDVVEDYVRSSRAAKLPFGFYLTWNYNYLFNKGNGAPPQPPSAPGQLPISEDDYTALMTATMAEVWGRYPGEIFEIWFVRGARQSRRPPISFRLSLKSTRASLSAPPLPPPPPFRTAVSTTSP